jgi:hypothetical protein
VLSDDKRDSLQFLPFVVVRLGDGLQTVIRERIFVVTVPRSLEGFLDTAQSGWMANIARATRREGR